MVDLLEHSNFGPNVVYYFYIIMKMIPERMSQAPEPAVEEPLPANAGGPLGPIYPHVAAGQRACLGLSKGSFSAMHSTSCISPCTPPFTLLLLHFSFCTPPFAFLRTDVLQRTCAIYHLVCFQIGFLQVSFLSCYFPKEIF